MTIFIFSNIYIYMEQTTFDTPIHLTQDFLLILFLMPCVIQITLHTIAFQILFDSGGTVT